MIVVAAYELARSPISFSGHEFQDIRVCVWVCVQTAATCPYVGPITETAQLTPWQAMCLHLLCERARGEKSPWYPYITLLPSELQMAGSHPMLWPQVIIIILFQLELNPETLILELESKEAISRTFLNLRV